MMEETLRDAWQRCSFSITDFDFRFNSNSKIGFVIIRIVKPEISSGEVHSSLNTKSLFRSY